VSLTTTCLSSSLFSTLSFSWVASIDWMKYCPSERMILHARLSASFLRGGDSHAQGEAEFTTGSIAWLTCIDPHPKRPER
jgi:hypothetical protein